jgi:hypothetical protein
MKTTLTPFLFSRNLLVYSIIFLITNCSSPTETRNATNPTADGTEKKVTIPIFETSKEDQIFLNTSALGSENDSIRSNTFEAMYEMAKDIHLSNNSCTNYITAVGVILGLDKQNKMKLLYEPLCLCRNTNSVIKHLSSYDVKGSSTKVLYEYDHANGKFTLYKQNDDNMQQSIDWTGDVEYQILTFQEINALIGINNSPFIKIWNTGHKYPIVYQSTYGADSLPHLCPPSCNPITYKLK